VTGRTATWIGASLAAFCVVSQIVLTILELATSQDWFFGFAPNVLGFPIIGAIIVSRQPRNAIGWVLVIGSTAICLGLFCAATVFATLNGDPAFWQQTLAIVANMSLIGGFEGLIMAMAFLFPTGRPLTPRWRTVGMVVGTVFVLSLIVLTFGSGPAGGIFAESPELTNPFVIPGVDAIRDSMGFVAVPLTLGVTLISLCALVVRFRRSRGIERRQLQWLALALGVLCVSLVVQVPANLLVPEGQSWLITVSEGVFFPVGTLGVSIAIGIAILRYQLYDIERLINRGLVYLTLTVTLALVYLGLVLLLGGALRSLTGATSSIVTAVSTLLAAALFSPLRSMIQRFVDRRFYRRKYDAARMLEGFSARLRNEVDLDALSTDLQAVVTESMQPAHVSLWLRPTSNAKS
jgi:hypothetical protein